MFIDNYGMEKYDHNDINFLDSEIDKIINNYAIKNGLRLDDYEFRTKILATEVSNIIRVIHFELFHPPIEFYKYITIHRTKLDLHDIELIQWITEKYLAICNYFNKPLGLYSYSVLIGVDYSNLYEWATNSQDDKKLTAVRTSAVQKVRDYKARGIVNSLQAAPVGIMAVANNDKETGLEWAKNNQTIEKQTTVYYLPSERANRLNLDKQGE